MNKPLSSPPMASVTRQLSRRSVFEALLHRSPISRADLAKVTGLSKQTMSEVIDAFEQQIEPKLGIPRDQASLAMAVLTQLTTAVIALLIGYLLFSNPEWGVYELLQASVVLLLIVIVCNRFLPFVFFSRTKGEWLIRWTFFLRLLMYLVRPLTLILGFLKSVASLTQTNTTEEPETSAEAVDALIEAGQEEGIIQEGEEIVKEAGSKDQFISDLSLIGAAQKVEHYEIAGYGNARMLALQIDEREVARLFDHTLGEEESTDHLLTEISKPLLQQASSEDLAATTGKRGTVTSGSARHTS